MYGCIVLCGHEVMDFYICDVCGWQNTDINNVDGGPNHMTLEGAKKAYADGREIN
ncbi:CPCC family cysteine-rich protein [Ligilactobacillus agilis]|uniref:CPCC family cysteine-rich protein n=1 Tax=Ligilactobacillus agilis TaxID=1601 RepID=UPI0036F1D79A